MHLLIDASCLLLIGVLCALADCCFMFAFLTDVLCVLFNVYVCCSYVFYVFC